MLALMMRQGGLDAQRKTSVSDIVTAADHAAEAYVLEQLRAAGPRTASSARKAQPSHGSSGRTWVIDPWTAPTTSSAAPPTGAPRLPSKTNRTCCWAPSSSRRRTSCGSAARAARPPSTAIPSHRSDGRGRPQRGELSRSVPPPTSTPAGSRIPCAPCPGMPRQLGRHAAHVRVRLMRPRARGGRRTWLLVPAQLPGMGLAARESDRARRRRRHRKRLRERAGMVHGRGRDGGAPAACGP